MNYIASLKEAKDNLYTVKFIFHNANRHIYHIFLLEHIKEVYDKATNISRVLAIKSLKM